MMSNRDKIPEPGISSHEFNIVKEEIQFSRYVQVFNRIVEHKSTSSNHPNNVHSNIVEYDVVGARTKNCHFVAVLPFNSSKKSFTLLKEYAQGANGIVYGVPCGGLSSYHTSLEHCATRELSEEAYLKGGKLIRLLAESHPGFLEVKWCKNRFTPFIVIDPEHDSNPHPRDKEEFIEILEVDYVQLKQLMYGGNMMLPSIVTCSMAIEYLKEQSYI